MTKRHHDPRQLELFGPAAGPGAGGAEPAASTRHAATAPPPHSPRSDARRGPAVGPAPAAPDLVEVARRLPPEIRLGTSSWTFPGWAGILYERKTSESALAHSGLAAYARHPLLRAVGIDRTYYAPIAAAEYARYAAQTPDDFRFLVKAHEWCVLPVFPRLDRYGARAGRPNDCFLNPAYAIDELVGPMSAGLGAKAGPLVFQFTPLNVKLLGGVERFLARLAEFLAALPAGPLYAVELRNREFFVPRYAEVLAATGAAHCFNVHPGAPPIGDQALLRADAAAAEPRGAAAARDAPPHGGNRALVVRWMLHSGLMYEEARERYAPFDRLVDEDPASRLAIAELALATAAQRNPVYVIANNKAEGSAPLTLFRLAREIAARAARSSGARGNAE
jgi:uncharacterized protein YecE (DUF72 family)